MFENIIRYFKKTVKKEQNKDDDSSKSTAKERLHLVLMQDRANVSADFLELMKQEIIEVIKKYIEVDENAIDVRLTNKENEDGTNGAPALYANIPILNIKNDARKIDKKDIEEHKNKKDHEEKCEETENQEDEIAQDCDIKEEEKQNKEESNETDEDNKEENKDTKESKETKD